jgi:phosphohistidine phosphatase SixA
LAIRRRTQIKPKPMTPLRIKRARRSAVVLLLAIVASCKTVPDPVRQPGETVAYIVRHAEKVMTAPKDLDPDITAQGRSRAQALADQLANAGVTRIIVTDLKRTEQTANPLATRLGITPEIVSVLLPAHTDSVAAAVLRHRGETILVVGHSNTVPQIIAALGGRQPQNICDHQYSDLFVVTIPASGSTRVVHRHFGVADPVESC